MKLITNNGETENRQSRANPLDVAWLAGMFDGEGSVIAQSFTSTKGNCTQCLSITLKISNTSLKLMEKAQRIIQDVSWKKFTIGNHSFTGGKRCFFVGVTDQRSTRKVLTAMLPHLTVKRAQAELGIMFCESRKENRHKEIGYTQWELGVVDEMKRLKAAEYTAIPMGGVTTECGALHTGEADA